MKFETDKVNVTASQSEVFAFLTDLNNYEKLMPSSISNWESTKETCSFKISGMANIGLALKQATPESRIDLKSYGDVMFPYEMSITLNKISDTETEAQLAFEGDVNPFMKVMVEKPIKEFFGYLIHKVQKHFAK